MIFRPEDGEWKVVVHRHADPITALQPAESVIPGADPPMERNSENSVWAKFAEFF
jgi:hypothetical protein